MRTLRRLYLQIYITVVASLVLFTALAGLMWRQIADNYMQNQALDVIAEMAQAALPAAAEPRSEQQATLERLNANAHVDLALFAVNGERLASVGKALDAPEPGHQGSGWIMRHREGPVWSIALPDGRTLIARLPGHARHPALGLVALLGLIALAVAVGAYPVVRRLTRRLERLQSSVEALGSGDLGVRVHVEGRDEVSSLARSFNRAAERIEVLVSGQRRVIAGASHELRSPLARLRMALELLSGDQQLKAGAEHDIAELDALIDELLLASRLDLRPEADRREEVDLLGLLAEEAARVGVEATGDPVRLKGEARLLRRLLRNLLENARRHGGDTEIEAMVTGTRPGWGLVRVTDRGPGVPEAERDRIFEPFYRPAGTPETGEGYGLGLSLVRQIARAHGGEARCLPHAGGGSLFEVELPSA
jgi:signal transduction histidine kinase